MYIEITSAANDRIKEAKKAAIGEDGLMLVEGVKPVCDAVAHGNKPVMLFSTKRDEKTDRLAEKFDLFLIPPYIMEKLADTKTPQSLAMIMKRPHEPEIPKSGKYILCENIQDPKNLGAIIRTADSFGIDGILLYGNNADCYSPKTTRGSMTSNLNLPIRKISEEELISLKKDFELYAAILDDKAKSLCDITFGSNVIMAIGNEGKGITERLSSLCDSVYIPMKGKAQSLNAAVAASVIIWEMTK